LYLLLLLFGLENKYDDDDDTAGGDDSMNAAQNRGAHPSAAPASSLNRDLTLIDNDLYE